ncbi:hypothetical protein VHEMI07151 [[Torrubiella] hemipterigena]|uniref:Uncharacterized protein n=1 Tax=[Torrubiella] hemipterigena TaxID=1531966 RepID=A0A0A1T2M4_9HYPO|nr:hypothetical protein VHEMI07151 [[Torrubiella] hemipterigena]
MSTEVYCQLCGIPSNIGRLRTSLEPVEAGWSRDGTGAILNECAPDCTDCLTTTDNNKQIDVREFDEVLIIDDDATEEEDYTPDDEDTLDDPIEYMSEDELDRYLDDDNMTDQDSHPTGSQEVYKEFLSGLTATDNNIVPFPGHSNRADVATDEHIAGGRCRVTQGYNGNNISAQEMRGTCTMQFLVPKTADWKSEDDDEDFEKDPSFPYHLSGLSDFVSLAGTQHGGGFPARHDVKDGHATNLLTTETHTSQHMIPFHPTCLEIYKRACLKRLGKVDMLGLVNWYRLEATKTHFLDNFPRTPEVENAREERWKHVSGDEWLAANPCFIPGLSSATERASSDSNDLEFAPLDSVNETDEFGKLSQEMRVEILRALDPNDTQSWHRSLQSFGKIHESYFREVILVDMPWLWEAWTDASYSSWATQSERELRSKWDRPETQDQAQRELLILRLEGKSNLSIYEQVWLEQLLHDETEFNARQNIARQIKLPALVNMKVNWREIYIELRKIESVDNGLRNRKRVWDDCNYILDRVAYHTASGRIVPDKVVDGGFLETGTPDYSDDEEFGDEDVEEDSEDDFDVTGDLEMGF